MEQDGGTKKSLNDVTSFSSQTRSRINTDTSSIKDSSHISLKSRIHPQVKYKPTRKIHADDYKVELTAYEIEAFDREFVIALGNIQKEWDKYGVYYRPIYFVPSNKQSDKIQIGVYEYEKKHAVKYMDVDGDLDINLLVPIFFSFAETVVNETTSKVEDFLAKTPSPKEARSAPDDASISSEDEPQDEEQSSSEEEDVFQLPKSTKKTTSKDKSTESIEEDEDLEESTGKTRREGPFEIDLKVQPPPPLPKESKEDAKKIKKDYSPSENKPWIQQFTKNPNYEIVQVENNGDCFFATIREGFKQIGYKTTVAELRAILVKEITHEIYQENRKLYEDLSKTKNEYDQDIEGLMRRMQELKQKYKLAPNQVERDRIRLETEEMRVKYNELQTWKMETNSIISGTMGDLSAIDTFEKYKAYLMTSQYWADSWAISTLERVLNVKMIIFAETSFREGAIHSVLQCGETDKAIQKSGKFDPKYYIMTSYSGNHYNLLAYKGKRILTFDEIPYDVKIMIVNKCVETNAGIFYLIEDFRNLKVELGLQADVGHPIENSDDEYEVEVVEEELEEGPIESLSAQEQAKKVFEESVRGVSKSRSNSISKHDLYDSAIVFRFYYKSENTPLPGKGTGEQIPKDKILDYKELKGFKDWRRKLDDSWTDEDHPIQIEGNKYASVEHYIQSSKFRYRGAGEDTKKFADIFTLNKSEDKIRLDVALAKAAGSSTGKIKDPSTKKMVTLRPKEVEIDPGYETDGRQRRERIRALRSKFNKNPEMSMLLKLTNRAKLVQYIPKQEPVVDIDLMEVRRTIMI